MNQAEIQAALNALHKEYANNLPTRVDEIETQWRKLIEDAWDAERFKELIRLAHSLKGSGATYGYVQVSAAARALELYAKSLDASAAPDEQTRAQMELLLVDLRASILEKPKEAEDFSAPRDDAPTLDAQ